jgi:hypothetical protein
MRLLHLIFAVLLVAIAMSVSRDPAGRVALVVFCTSLGEVFLGTTAVLALFQTIGAFGHAKGLPAHAEAFAATTLVLTIATVVMTGLLFIGAWLVRAVVA